MSSRHMVARPVAKTTADLVTVLKVLRVAGVRTTCVEDKYLYSLPRQSMAYVYCVVIATKGIQ